MSGPELKIARSRAAAARGRLIADAQALQLRLRPASIADNAMDMLKRKGEAVAEETVAAVRRRPIVVSAAGAGVAALIGAGLFARLRRHRHTAEEED